jgi:hypothetical protein
MMQEGRMKYLCLASMEEKQLEALSQSELEALHAVQTATTVRLRHGKLSITDGPFAETKEQLGGFWRINARDLPNALPVAAQMPLARLGSIEVRPMAERQSSNHNKRLQ